MERGFGGEGVPDFPGWDAGGYIFRCFVVFFSGRFLGVVFRVSRDAFFGFRVPLALGVSRGVSRTSFLKEFREFFDFQALCFSDISELRGTPEDEKR